MRRTTSADGAEVVRIAESWVAQLYGRGPNHEWAYGRVPRRILVEELLVGVDGAFPDEATAFPTLWSPPEKTGVA